MRLIDPLLGKYDASDPFGNPRPSGSKHLGSDWIVPSGTPVPAIGSGTVTAKGYTSYNGTYVTVLLPDGHYYAYIHLTDVVVNVGDHVTIGQIIAHSGQSGSNANIPGIGGPHLHITVSTSPQAADGIGPLTDPWAFIQAHINDTDPVTPSAQEEEEQDVYIRRIATGEVAVFGSDYRAVTGGTAGRHIFASPTEWNAWISVLTTYNAQIDALGLDPRGKKFVPPAAPGNVMGVDDNGWAIVCGMYGV